MLVVAGKNDIIISKGESALLVIDITGGSLNAGDLVKFAVKRAAGDGAELIAKTAQAGEDGQTRIEIELGGADFTGLSPGNYKYDLARINGAAVNYLIFPADFIIAEVIANAG